MFLSCDDFYESGYLHHGDHQVCCLHCGPCDDDDAGCELELNLCPANKNGVYSKVEGVVCCRFGNLTRDDVARAVRYKRSERDSG